MADERHTEELSDEQRTRAAREERLAQMAPEEDEVAQHERRAAKARYLQDKLDERARSERDSERS